MAYNVESCQNVNAGIVVLQGEQTAQVGSESGSLKERLGLNDDEYASLMKQGFVSRDVRSGNLVVYKLRFRINRKQRVKYLGTDALVAASIAEELAGLQRLRQMKRELREINHKASNINRAAREQLSPLLEEAGYRFHGRAIRAVRKSAVVLK